jgi:NAD-dependent protein deacetylase/lipoamidase
MEAPANEIARLGLAIQAAKRIVVFTGAGISTECGIPDFRSPGGIWTRYKPIEFSEYLASAETRLEAWRRYFRLYDEVKDAKPGRGHRVIAGLVQAGKASHVITQNIDDLHRKSGVPAELILELHGNGTYAACLACGLRHELDWAREEIDRRAKAPACTRCGGIVKTATISFGQPMPEDIMARAHAATEAADLFLAIGSSLKVYPAATLPMLAKRWGAHLAIINREATDFDGIADFVIQWDAGEALAGAVGGEPSESLASKVESRRLRIL